MLAPDNRRPDPLPKQRMSSDERRQAIVQAAVTLFAEKGFRGATTRELAAAVGVTEPVLYQHFATKRDLYTAIIDAKSQEGMEKLALILGPYMETSDDRGFFTGLADLILAWYSDDPAYIRLLLFSALERHELAQLSYDRQAAVVFQMVAGYIDRRISDGAMRPIESVLAARSFIGMVAHYALGGVVFQCVDIEATRHEVVPVMVDLFLAGMKADPQPGV